MQVGAIYPQTELGGDPAAVDQIGRAVEALGYDYLAMFDHVAGAEHADRDPPLWGPYTENDPFHDPFVAFGYLAGITERIELVTGILVLPQRQTVLVARQAVDVDLLSGGRLRLGIGIGWNFVEFEALGEDFHARGKRMAEQIEVLRKLWAEPVIDYTGAFHRIARAGLNPRPARPIPIYSGGLSEAAYRRAARLCDGFIFGGSSLEERVLPAWRQVQEYVREAGRNPAGFGADYQVPTTVDPTAVADLMRRWEDAGGTHAAVRTMGLGFTTAQQHIDFLAEVRERVR